MWLAGPHRTAVSAAPPPRPPAVMADLTDASDFTRPENFTRFPVFNITALDYFTESIVSVVNIYYTPILVILGTIGNLLSIYVFYTSKLRTLSTSQYLTALAVSDTVFIIQLLPPWLNAVDATGLFHQEYFCQVFVYVSYVSCSLSSWLVVAFTAERFVAVLHPLRRNLLCTVERARVVVLALTGAAAALNLPVLRFATPLRNDCNIDVAYYDHAARFNIVDTAVSFTIPLAVIIVLNTWITVGVCRLERARQQLVRAGGRGRRDARGALPPARSQYRVTRMLLIVSTVFVLFNLPAYTMRICAYAMDMEGTEHSGVWGALQQLALMFFNTNFGINFILYCMSGQNFRRALKLMLPRWWRRRQQAAPVRVDTSAPVRASSLSIIDDEGNDISSAFYLWRRPSTPPPVVHREVDQVVQVSARPAPCTYTTFQASVVSMEGPSAHTPHLHRRVRTVQRWKFDNSRQQQQRLQRLQELQNNGAEELEMQVIKARRYD